MLEFSIASFLVPSRWKPVLTFCPGAPNAYPPGGRRRDHGRRPWASPSPRWAMRSPSRGRPGRMADAPGRAFPDGRLRLDDARPGRPDPLPPHPRRRRLALHLFHPVLAATNARTGWRVCGPGPMTSSSSRSTPRSWRSAWRSPVVSSRFRSSWRAERRLAELATTDELTGLKNRREFLRALESHFSWPTSGSPLSLVMMDIDHFKAHNDAFGHPAGTRCCRVGRGVAGRLPRPRDGRPVRRRGVRRPPGWGSGPESARGIAERIRAALAGREWPHRPITASIGIATIGAAPEGPEGPGTDDLIKRADLALYRSEAPGPRSDHASATTCPTGPPRSRSRWSRLRIPRPPDAIPASSGIGPGERLSGIENG